jgi:saccharopine dehydrogenase-like NADP-dependent oxidoreductase
VAGATYAVHGAGRQGLAAIYDLVRFGDAQRVLVGEPDERRATLASERLGRLLGGAASRVAFTPKVDDADLKETAVILSCAPHVANLALTKQALRVGKPYCDLGGNPGVVKSQERLARGARVPVIPECGVSPGLSNILATHFVKALGCDEIGVRCGGIPLREPDRTKNPLGYRIVFSARGMLSEYSGAVPVVREGRVTSVEALSVVEPSDIDPRLEGSPTSNNAPHVAAFLASIGVRSYNYMTLRYRGHWSLARRWRARGFLKGDDALDERLARRLDADPALRYRPGRDRDRLILSVRGFSGPIALRRSHEFRLDVVADPRTEFSAMELTTSWGITIVADAIARGHVRHRGFATPERLIDGAFVLREVERRLAITNASPQRQSAPPKRRRRVAPGQ